MVDADLELKAKEMAVNEVFVDDPNIPEEENAYDFFMNFSDFQEAWKYDYQMWAEFEHLDIDGVKEQLRSRFVNFLACKKVLV